MIQWLKPGPGKGVARASKPDSQPGMSKGAVYTRMGGFLSTRWAPFSPFSPFPVSGRSQYRYTRWYGWWCTVWWWVVGYPVYGVWPGGAWYRGSPWYGSGLGFTLFHCTGTTVPGHCTVPLYWDNCTGPLYRAILLYWDHCTEPYYCTGTTVPYHCTGTTVPYHCTGTTAPVHHCEATVHH